MFKSLINTYLYTTILILALYLGYLKIYKPLQELKEIKKSSATVDRDIKTFDKNVSKLFKKVDINETIPTTRGYHSINL